MGVLELLVKAQYEAAKNNNNVSSAIVRQMAAVGETFEKSVAAALLSIGGPVHAPTTDARYILFRATDKEITSRLKAGKIAGFGNAFYKDKVDPAFASFFTHIELEYPEVWKRMAHVIGLIIEEKGKFVFPNAAAATAMAAEILNVPYGTEAQLLMMGRLPAWAEIWSGK